MIFSVMAYLMVYIDCLGSLSDGSILFFFFGDRLFNIPFLCSVSQTVYAFLSSYLLFMPVFNPVGCRLFCKHPFQALGHQAETPTNIFSLVWLSKNK